MSITSVVFADFNSAPCFVPFCDSWLYCFYIDSAEQLGLYVSVI